MLIGLQFQLLAKLNFWLFQRLSQDDRQLFQLFLQRVEIIGLVASDAALIEKIIEIRLQYRLKLPDAVIAAMAIQNSASLVSADTEFAKVTILTVMNW